MKAAEKSYWPFNSKGRLDDTLFDEDFIKDVFFKFIPIEYKCTHNNVRKGLQTIYKKSFATKKTNTIANKIALDICSSSKARAQLPNMKLILDHKNSFSRGPRTVKKLNKNFVDLLWLYYSQTEYQSLVDWVKSIAPEYKKVNENYYITGNLLQKNYEEEKCPIPFNSIEMARAITILAGRLDEPEKIFDLLKTANKLGNKYIHLPQEQLQSGPKKPKLKKYTSLVDLPDISINSFKIKEDGQVAKIKELDSLIQSQRSEIKKVDQILVMSKKNFDVQVKKLTTLRNVMSDSELKSKKQINKQNQKLIKILSFIQIDPEKVLENEFDHKEKLIAYYEISDRIVQTYEKITNKNIIYHLLNIDSINSINNLINLLENALKLSEKNNLFVSNFENYVKKSSADFHVNLVSQIQKWTFDEGVALFLKLSTKEYALSFSVLWSFLFERKDGKTAGILLASLLANKYQARLALHFVNPHEIDVVTNPIFVRLILRELIIDMLLFGKWDCLIEFYNKIDNKNVFGAKIQRFMVFVKEHKEISINGPSYVNFCADENPEETLLNRYSSEEFDDTVYGKIHEYVCRNYFVPTISNLNKFSETQKPQYFL